MNSTSALALLARELAQHETDRKTWLREKSELQEQQIVLVEECEELKSTNILKLKIK